MAVLGRITVNLTARTAAFAAGMQRAQGILGRFRRGVAAAGAAMLRIGAVAAGVGIAGATAFAWWQKGIFENIDAQAKLADSLGLSTEGLAGLTLAAKLSGVEQAQLADSLKTMGVNLGQAAMGTGRARKYLKALGLSVSDLLSLAPEEQFSRLADAINALPTATERAAAAAGIFGGNSQKLLTVLALGSRGLAEMRKEADRLGLSFKRVDALLVEQANDALSSVGEVIRGLGQKIAVGLAPFVTAAAQEFERLGLAAQNSLAGNIVAGAEKAAMGLAVISDAIEGVKAVFYALGSVVLEVFNGILETITAVAETAADLTKYKAVRFLGGWTEQDAEEIRAGVADLRAYQKEIEQRRDSGWQLAAEAAEKFARGDAQAKAAAAFKRIEAGAAAARRASETAAAMRVNPHSMARAAMAAGLGQAAPESPAAAAAAAPAAAVYKPGEFGVGPLKYHVPAFGGAGTRTQPQEVRSPFFEQITSLLGQIRFLLAGGQGVD